MTAPLFTTLAALAFEPRHQGAHRALVQQTENLQFVVYRLDPGGSIPAHHHSGSWDISLVLSGALVVTCRHPEVPEVCRCEAGAIGIVPPGVVHAIANASETEPATFALLQSPGTGFDFVRAGATPES